MNKEIFSWILFLFLTLPAALHAQSSGQDYVLTTAGDTLRGRIKITQKPVKTVWLYRTGQPADSFTANQLRGYGDPKGLLETTRQVGPHGKKEFVSALVTGYVSLFIGVTSDGTNRFFLQPADSAYVVEVSAEVPRLSYLRVMGNRCAKIDFSDARLESKYRYSPRGLTQLVLDYNACLQQPSQIIANTSGGLRLLPGFQAGLNLVSTGRGGTGYQVGALVQATNKSAFSIRAELIYSKIRREYDPEDLFNGFAPYTTSRTIKLDYGQLQLPITVRYTIGHGLLRPHVAAGLLGALNFRNKSTAAIKKSSEPAPVVYPLDYPGSSSIGATGGVGLSFYQPKGFVPGLELRYDYIPADPEPYDKLQLNAIRFNFSVMF
ncbi:porin family protein [Hymenobacter actinosclerus]|uniref:Outer membrane protein beta-barrel domain-containing protein n=1 Tax=Hymenobacter actinosclerus TaxID=82805 RepID=A0A1I0BWR3_9BACT|nr:porin family protein [Hymenobacter actinosclerus]SET11422.1 Outer membrane protein beta-barrel domain-containing protein [Hymenobacter actinosclerus]